ncbi:recombinase family protein [Brevundimonas sp. S30B]|uniref:recombinase family protein n=1 Tax=unclassified Brevundimonas TaxID=2622653 RepID=UPI0010726F61|nr:MULTISPECIES: recombinase family protein [unclassified Brevundimonas]QBX37251.1 recombinase family protein [Brevundimonas sp. MF30-B]TFW03956.1 recombinase family protein [Brevundimonas sp. S30B]
MALIGYARVSSTGQSLEVQRDQLLAAGCTRLFEEKRSGGSQDGREQLALALDYVRDGDTLVVTRLDRLARSITDLRQIIDRLTAKQVAFRALQQGDVDTSTSNGRLMLNLLGAFAEFETDLRRERQKEGILKAKAKGVYRGRKPSVPVEAIKALKAEGVAPTEIAKRLKIGRASVYRALAA